MSGKPIKSRRSIRILAAVIVLAIAVVVVLELTNTTHFFHTAKAKSGIIPPLATSSKKAAKSNPLKTADSNGSSTSPKDNATGSAPAATSSTQPPAKPFGSFVSNHRPNLSGQSSSSTELSVCDTTPGATCYIQFTQGSVVKKLSAQTTNSDGVTSWAWDVKQAGFSQGTWQIAGVATLNDQTVKTDDTLNLIVGP